MELQIQDLVSSIKQDGIDSANREAAAIVAQAKAQADSIISQAKADADKLRQDANAEIEVFKTAPVSVRSRPSVTPYWLSIRRFKRNLKDPGCRCVQGTGSADPGYPHSCRFAG